MCRFMQDLLDRYDVQVSAFGQGSAKSLEDLYQEAVINKKSILTDVPPAMTCGVMIMKGYKRPRKSQRDVS